MARVLAAALLDTESRAAAAALLAESFDKFYEKLGIGRSVLCGALAEELLETGTELEFTKVVAVSEKMGGVLAAYPAEQMGARQRASMFHLLSALPADLADALIDQTAKHTSTISPVPTDSYYLARLAVAAEYRGQGLADILMKELRAAADGRYMSLHVHRANARAISLYRRHGFDHTADERLYLCMTGK